MFFASVDDRVLIANICFETKFMERYVKISEEMVHSFRIIGREQE